MEALTEVVRQGKARYLGFSEWTADQIRAALALVPGVEKFVSSQPQYSLLYRVPEREVIPLCKENGISQIVWSPLAQGALTGKYKPGRGACRRNARCLAADGLGDGQLPRRRRPRESAAARADRRRTGMTMAQLALAWVLREENVAAAIVGASRPEQVEENAGASGIYSMKRRCRRSTKRSPTSSSGEPSGFHDRARRARADRRRRSARRGLLSRGRRPRAREPG